MRLQTVQTEQNLYTAIYSAGEDIIYNILINFISWLCIFHKPVVLILMNTFIVH